MGNLIFIVVFVVFIAFAGYMIWQNKQKEAAEKAKWDAVIPHPQSNTTSNTVSSNTSANTGS